MSLTIEQCVRLAAVLDCEGYIGIIKTLPKGPNRDFIYDIRISVGMTNPVYPTVFKALFEGCLRKRQGRGMNWKPQYDWSIGGIKAQSCLIALMSRLLIKEKQAIACYKLMDLRHNTKVWRSKGRPLQLTEAYERLYQECLVLNKRGNSAMNRKDIHV